MSPIGEHRHRILIASVSSLLLLAIFWNVEKTIDRAWSGIVDRAWSGISDEKYDGHSFLTDSYVWVWGSEGLRYQMFGKGSQEMSQVYGDALPSCSCRWEGSSMPTSSLASRVTAVETKTGVWFSHSCPDVSDLYWGRDPAKGASRVSQSTKQIVGVNGKGKVILGPKFCSWNDQGIDGVRCFGSEKKEGNPCETSYLSEGRAGEIVGDTGEALWILKGGELIRWKYLSGKPPSEIEILHHDNGDTIDFRRIVSVQRRESTTYIVGIPKMSKYDFLGGNLSSLPLSARVGDDDSHGIVVDWRVEESLDLRPLNGALLEIFGLHDGKAYGTIATSPVGNVTLVSESSGSLWYCIQGESLARLQKYPPFQMNPYDHHPNPCSAHVRSTGTTAWISWGNSIYSANDGSTASDWSGEIYEEFEMSGPSLAALLRRFEGSKHSMWIIEGDEIMYRAGQGEYRPTGVAVEGRGDYSAFRVSDSAYLIHTWNGESRSQLEHRLFLYESSSGKSAALIDRFQGTEGSLIKRVHAESEDGIWILLNGNSPGLIRTSLKTLRSAAALGLES